MTGLVLSFAVGVISSLAASGLIVSRQRARSRTSFGAILRQIIRLADQLKTDNYHPDVIGLIPIEGVGVGV